MPLSHDISAPIAVSDDDAVIGNKPVPLKQFNLFIRWNDDTSFVLEGTTDEEGMRRYVSNSKFGADELTITIEMTEGCMVLNRGDFCAIKFRERK